MIFVPVVERPGEFQRVTSLRERIMSGQATRREFIKQGGALSAAFWVTGPVAFADSKSPMERLNFACIGVQGKGSSDTDSAGTYGNVIALCDIDDVRLDAKAKKFPKAKKYNDYRKMLADLGNKIDAVTVSTPDHTHAPASIRAMRMGKHCFCQKPLTHSVYEARLMRQVAREKKVATQMGNQGTSLDGLRDAVEIVRAGGIGDVREVHVWTNRSGRFWKQAMPRPKATPPVPNNVHWYLWLGSAPDRPYHPIYHPFSWRGWLDFGTGALGDMACHTANMAVMALDLFDPITVEAQSSGVVADETYPAWSIITYQFAKRGKRPPVKLVWYDGGKRPPRDLVAGSNVRMPSSGSILVGDKGTLYSPNDYGARFFLLPKEKFADYKKPEPTLARSPGHFKEFAIACQGGPAAMSNFDYASRLTETMILGNVALRVGKKIHWDARNMRVTNAPEAAQYIKTAYRPGFEL